MYDITLIGIMVPWGPPRVKVRGGQSNMLDWASDWNVTKLLCINKVKCHKMLIYYYNAINIIYKMQVNFINQGKIF